MDMEYNQVIRLGNVSIGDSQGGMVYSIKGIYATITCGGHGYSAGNFVVLKDEYRKYSKKIRECL